MSTDEPKQRLERQNLEQSVQIRLSQKETLSPEAEARRVAAQLRREQRLAQALRENLKRRKVQIRNRSSIADVETGFVLPSSDKI
jgi:hypothetical protein